MLTEEKKKLSGSAKRVLLFALFAAMFVLFVILIDQRIGIFNDSPDESSVIPDEIKKYFGDDSHSFGFGGEGTKQITPDFIGVTLNGKRKCVFCDDEAAEELFSKAGEFVSYVLSDGFDRRKCADDSDYKRALRKENSLYICFTNELPDAAIFTLCVNDGADLTAKYGCLIRNILIFAGKDGRMYAYSRDDSGEITAFSENKPVIAESFNNMLAEEYNEEGNVPGSFVFPYELSSQKSAFIKNVSFYDFPIVTSPITSSSIYTIETIGDLIKLFDINTFAQNDVFKELLNSFGINPVVTKSYNSDEKLIFVNKNVSLTVFPAGYVLYEAEDGSLPIKNLIGESDVGGDFERRTRAACVFVASLPDTLFGGQSRIKLTETAKDEKNGTVYYKFAFYYDGIRITADDDPSLIVGVSDKEIVYARIKGLFAGNDMGERIAVLPYDAFLMLTEKREIYSDPVIRYNIGYDKWVAADWAFMIG